MFNKYAFILLSLVSLIIIRLVPHLPNFSPLLTVSLFSGLIFKQPWKKFIIPFITLIVTDLILGVYTSLPYTYIAIALIILMSSHFKNQTRFLSLLKLSVVASLLFYFVSNMGVWLHSTIYTHSIDGLLTCYIAGLPFLQNTLISGLFFTSLFYIVLSVPKHNKAYLLSFPSKGPL